MNEKSTRRDMMQAAGVGLGLVVAQGVITSASAAEPPQASEEKGATSNLAASYVCRVKFLNNSNATITKTFAAFDYDDGSRSSDPSGGPGDVSIGHGESGYRYSQDKCVTKVYAFMVWTNGSGGQDLPAPPSGSCAIERGIELDPAFNAVKKHNAPSIRATVSILGEDGKPVRATEKDLAEGARRLKEIIESHK